jgi:hypothetical protein
MTAEAGKRTARVVCRKPGAEPDISQHAPIWPMPSSAVAAQPRSGDAAAVRQYRQRKAAEDVPRWKPGPVPWPCADTDLRHQVRDWPAKVAPHEDLVVIAQARLGREADLRSTNRRGMIPRAVGVRCGILLRRSISGTMGVLVIVRLEQLMRWAWPEDPSETNPTGSGQVKRWREHPRGHQRV